MTTTKSTTRPDIAIKRFTMADIREIIKNAKDVAGHEPHALDTFFNHDVSAFALKLATGLGDGDLDAMDLESVFALLEEVALANAFFVETMTRRFYSRETPSEPSLTVSAS